MGHRIFFAIPLVLIFPCVVAEAHEVSAAAGELELRQAQQRLYQYRYVEFPQMVIDLDRQIALAQAETARRIDRVGQYRPFRSFGRYAATYAADRRDQVSALAATYDLQRLLNERNQLWRRHRAIITELERQIAVARQTLESPR
jgi:hypothetical protein